MQTLSLSRIYYKIDYSLIINAIQLSTFFNDEIDSFFIERIIVYENVENNSLETGK